MISPVAPDDLVTTNRPSVDPALARGRRRACRPSALGAGQREVLRALLDVYVRRIPDDLADAKTARYASDDVARRAVVRLGRRSRARPAALLPGAGRRAARRVRQHPERRQPRPQRLARPARRLRWRRARRPLRPTTTDAGRSAHRRRRAPPPAARPPPPRPSGRRRSSRSPATSSACTRRDPATVVLSLRARLDPFAVADLEDALYERRTLLRMLAMRRTMFVVPLDLAAVMNVVVHAGARAGRAAQARRHARGGRRQRRRRRVDRAGRRGDGRRPAGRRPAAGEPADEARARPVGPAARRRRQEVRGHDRGVDADAVPPRPRRAASPGRGRSARGCRASTGGCRWTTGSAGCPTSTRWRRGPSSCGGGCAPTGRARSTTSRGGRSGRRPTCAPRSPTSARSPSRPTPATIPRRRRGSLPDDLDDTPADIAAPDGVEPVVAAAGARPDDHGVEAPRVVPRPAPRGAVRPHRQRRPDRVGRRAGGRRVEPARGRRRRDPPARGRRCRRGRSGSTPPPSGSRSGWPASA